MKKGALRSSFLLFLAAFIWGVAFVAQSVGMDYMGPFTFNGIRFLMGSAVLFPLVYFRRKKDKEKGKKRAGLKITLTGGICCGLALGAAALCTLPWEKRDLSLPSILLLFPSWGFFWGKRRAERSGLGRRWRPSECICCA